MTPSQLKGAFRSDMRDVVEDYLWSNEEIYRGIDDAQKMFCRLTDGIGDATTPEVVDITVGAGDEWVDLHPSILTIRGATRTSDGRPVGILNFEDLAPRGIRFDGTTGHVCDLVIGMEEGKARLSRVADEDDTVKLLVYRLPLTTITSDKDKLEIAEQHHLHLLHWVKHLLLLKQDAETFDKNKSDEMESRFRAYCAKVKSEQARARHKPRSIAYGGL